MATVIDPQPYVDAAKCYWCQIPIGLINYAILAALIDVGNGDPVPTDANELMAEATCLESCIPPGFVPYAILAAVSNIPPSGGGTGGAGIVGTGSPEGVETAPVGTSYFDSSANAFYYKRTGAGNTGWAVLIS